LPREVIDDGIVSDVNDEHPEKQALSRYIIEIEITTFLDFDSFENSSLGKSLMSQPTLRNQLL
jgi:hypothetical protein